MTILPNYRIILVDDHRIFMEAFKGLLEKDPRVEVIGCYTDAREMLNALPQNLPDLIIMDVQMPKLCGIEATKRVHASYPEIRVVALTQCTDSFTAKEMLKAGAAGYMTKDQVATDIHTLFEKLQKGEKYIAPEVAIELALLNVYNTPADLKSPPSQFTSRELTIIQFIANGKTDKEIALHLNISPKTVDKDKRNVMKIMRVNKVTQIVSEAFKTGLIS